MGQAADYGQRHRKFLHLPDAPRALMTRSLRGIELAATETRHDDPEPGLSGQFPAEDAYLVSLKLRDYPDCECWERGRCITKADVRAGATYLYDLKRDPRFVIDKPFHSIFFYLPRSALDDIARQSARHAYELAYQPGIGHDDAIIRHLGRRCCRRTAPPGRGQPAFHRSHDARGHRSCHPGLWRTAARQRAEPRRSCPMAGRSAPAKNSIPISAENFHCNRSRPNLTSRSAIFRAHFESLPACRRTSGCFASA